MAVGNGGPQALPSGCPAARASHVGGRPGLVNEQEPGRIEVELTFKPGFPSPQDVRPVLLRGMRRLFFTVIP